MFEITSDHIKLLQRMYVGWNDCEYGAPEINCKRPYGNSSVEYDVCEILGWEMEGDDGDSECYSSKQRKEAAKIHKEMETVLQIVLCRQSFTTGKYRLKDQYDTRSWQEA